MRKITFTCLLFFLWSSCDMPGSLEVRNSTSKKAQYIIYYKAQNGIKDTMVTEIPVKESRVVMFGFGIRWNNKSIAYYVSNMDKLEIILENDTTILSSNDELIDYFKTGKKGFLKKHMKIEIEEKNRPESSP